MWARIADKNPKARQIGTQQPAIDNLKIGKIKKDLEDNLAKEGYEYESIVTTTSIFPDDQAGVPICVSIKIPEMDDISLVEFKLKYPTAGIVFEY